MNMLRVELTHEYPTFTLFWRGVNVVPTLKSTDVQVPECLVFVFGGPIGAASLHE